MSQEKPNHPEAIDAVEDLYIQAILDASPEELRVELLAMGEDPDALVAGVDAAFERAFASCARADARHAGEMSATFEPSEVGVMSDLPSLGTAGAPNPFATHDKFGLKGVARNFGCNLNFLGRLKDRLVRTEDMSAGFLACLAEALGTGADLLAEFLSGPPQVPAAVRFKSDGKPEVSKKQSLAEAIENSGLTEDQKRHLRSL